MIDQANRVIAASQTIKVFEKGIQDIATDIEALVRQEEGGNLVLLTGPPCSGVTFLLENILPLTSVKLRPDFYSFDVSFAERLADAAAILQSGETIKRVPRYLFEILRHSGRRNVVMDDVDAFFNGLYAAENLKTFISDLLNGSTGVNVIISTKQEPLLNSLLCVVDKTHVISLPECPERHAGQKFAKHYGFALSRQLGVSKEIVKDLFCSCSIGDIVRTAQGCLLLALANSNSVSNLSLNPEGYDLNEIGGVLGFAAP